jgi:hypothetical protein
MTASAHILAAVLINNLVCVYDGWKYHGRQHIFVRVFVRVFAKPFVIPSNASKAICQLIIINIQFGGGRASSNETDSLTTVTYIIHLKINKPLHDRLIECVWHV